MSDIPFPNLDYDAIDNGEFNEVIYAKPNWVIKTKKSTYVFKNYDAALLGELILKEFKK